MIRIGAVGDVHLGEDGRGRYRPAVEQIAEHADLLLLAGDLTNYGTVVEARVVAGEFEALPVPVIGILGNHDYHDTQPEEVSEVLRERGIEIVQGDTAVVTVGGQRVGIAGVKGFGGGFVGASGNAFGEAEMKAFIAHTQREAAALEHALHSLDVDYRVALTHYSPTPETLSGEPPELYPFLGSSMLAEAIDSSAVQLAVHGHAHHGSEHGATPKGVPVRNVAQPVLDSAFAVYRLDSRGLQ